MKTSIALAFACLTLASCVNVSKSVLSNSYADKPVPYDQVQILLASMDDVISPNCKRVAILNASGDEDFNDRASIFDALREEAGLLGANTIFIQNVKDPETSERVFNAIFGGINKTDSEAIAMYCPK